MLLYRHKEKENSSNQKGHNNEANDLVGYGWLYLRTL